MKNIICKKQILNSIIFLCLFVFISNTILSQPYIINGDFEYRVSNNLPTELSPSYMFKIDKYVPGYIDNQLMKCIDFCKSMLELESTYICKKK